MSCKAKEYVSYNQKEQSKGKDGVLKQRRMLNIKDGIYEYY
jgi:hypothetical protein